MDQELIFKILVGVSSSLLIIFLTYIFKRRQLYVVTENLYRTSEITDKGILCEISIFNRGRQTEEDIRVSLDNTLKYELLAFNDTNMTLDNSIIKIDRLHKKSKTSVLLIVENGDFSFKQILQVDSKFDKGKVIKRVEEIPLNVLDIILLFSIVMGFVGIVFYLGYIEGNRNILNNQYISGNPNIDKLREEEYKKLEKIGWLDITSYKSSKLSKSYFGTEFPIRFMEKQIIDDGRVIFTFDVINKTALPMDISVDIADKSFIQETESNIKYYSNISNVAALSKQQIITKPIDINKFKELEFFLVTRGTSYDEKEVLYNLIYKIE